jgi:DNA-directed RNA polymerase subunit RPC12/RpoP
MPARVIRSEINSSDSGRSCANCAADLGADAHPNRRRCPACSRKIRDARSAKAAKRRYAYTKTIDLRSQEGCPLCGRLQCDVVVDCVRIASERVVAVRSLWDWRDQTGPNARALADMESGI